MKAIIWKELRECSTWAALGLILVGVANYFGFYMAESSPNPTMLWDVKVTPTVIFSVLSGMLLGTVQILPELRRDQWAFLVHRPVTATRLFAGKVVAGLLMLACIVIIPDVALFYWVRIHQGYEIITLSYLLLSTYIGLATAIVFYFSAIIAALRPARIIGSRLLSIFAAGASVFAFLMVSRIWESILLSTVSVMILAVAAAACFCARGEYRRMGTTGRVALGFTLLIGSIAVVGVGCVFASILMTHRPRYANTETDKPLLPGKTLVADKHGKVFAVQWKFERKRSARDKAGWLVSGTTIPEGKPVSWPQTETPNKYFTFLEVIHSNALPYRRHNFVEGRYSRGAGDQGWNSYFDEIANRFVFYSQKKRRVTGYSGPGGFYTADNTPSREKAYFPGPLLNHPGQRFLWFASGIYEVSNAGRNIKKIITAEPGQAITSFRLSQDGATDIWIVTGNALEKYNVSGKRLRRTLLEPKELQSDYIGVIDADSDSDNNLILLANIHDAWKGKHSLHSRILETSADGTIVRKFNLPVLAMDAGYTLDLYSLLNIAVPGWRFDNTKTQSMSYTKTFQGGLFGYAYRSNNSLPPLWVHIASAIMSAVIVCFITFKAGFKLQARLFWAVIALPLGAAAIVALLALCSWPVRIVCVQCGRKRSVECENCKYCHTPWPSPQRDGTEILSRDFETQALVSGGRE